MALLNIASKLGNAIYRGAGCLMPKLKSSLAGTQHQEYVDKDNYKNNSKDELQSKEIIETVNRLAEEKSSRSFAIVHLLGKQRRVTDGDLILMEGRWAPNLGDQIRLDKVLMAGTKDFSLIGTPLVQPGLVDVKATVVGKALSTTRTNFRKKRRKQYMRINFVRAFQTVLRINHVHIKSNLNSPDNVF